MLDSETVVRTPHSKADARTSVSMKDRGCELVVFFADPGRQGPVLEFRIVPGEEELAPHALRRFMPQAPLYVTYARAVMSDKEGDWLATSKALRDFGSTRRGLTDDFYRLVSGNYAALLAEDEKYPVKALSEMHHVSISAASRWLTEARRRGLLDG
jgi:hypothetical protein